MIIGVLGRKVNNNIQVGTRYLEYLHKWGYTPLVIDPWCSNNNWDQSVERIISNIDGLLIPGGIDITPNLYGAPFIGAINCDLEYDTFQMQFITKALNKIPIFGICRGFQLLGVYAGLDMIQDMNLWDGHEHAQNMSRNGLMHKVNIDMTTNFGKFMINTFHNNLKDKIKNSILTLYVNSLHHQAFRYNTRYMPITDPKLLTLGTATGGLHINEHDKEEFWHITEIFEYINTEQKVLGVQFHPEEFILNESYGLRTAWKVKDLYDSFYFSGLLLRYVFGNPDPKG